MHPQCPRCCEKSHEITRIPASTKAWGWPKFENVWNYSEALLLPQKFSEKAHMFSTSQSLCRSLKASCNLHDFTIPISFVHLQGFRSLFLRHLRQVHGLVELSAPNASNHGAQVGELKGLKGILRATLQQHRREMGWTSMVRLGTCQAPAGSWGFMDAEECWKNPVKKTSETSER